MNLTPLRVLIVEDNEDDEWLLINTLKKESFAVESTRVCSPDALRSALDDGPWDIVISDYRMPDFTGIQALEILRRRNKDVPFIIVSGTISDELAVTAMRSGAQDYVMKDNMSRLGPAIRRELEEFESRQARRLAEESYEILVEHSLQGLATIDNGTFSFVNPALSEILGVERDHLIGLSTDEILDFVHPENRRLFTDRCLNPESSHTAGQRDELRMITASGEPCWVTMYTSRIVLADRDVTQTTFVDISDRKQRELELQSMASLASALRTATSRAEMPPVLLDQTLELLGADATALAVVDGGGDTMAFELARGVWSDVLERPASNHGPSADVVAKGHAVEFPDLDPSDPLAFSRVGDLDLHTIGVPLIAGDHPVGVLWIGRMQEFTAGDRQVATALADMAASALRRASLHAETSLRLQRLHSLRSIDLAITTGHDIATTLDILLEEVVFQLQVDGAAILRTDRKKELLKVAAVHGSSAPQGTLSDVRLGEGLAGHAAREQRLVEVTALDTIPDVAHRDKTIQQQGIVGYLAVPLVASGELCGVLELFHSEALEQDSEWRGFLETIAWQAAIAIDNAGLIDELRRSNRELMEAYESTLEGWARALELRDQETEGHARRVIDLTEKLARAVGIDGEDLIDARRGALLHDIGKMAVPDAILLKPGPLDEREWEIMRQHPQHAVDMLADIHHLRPALVIPYGHHERWDGTGYPQGLAGEDIPLPARVFAVVDVWDALRSDRPYRQSWPKEQVIAYLREQAGTTLDPMVVKAFLEIVHDA